MKFIFTTAETGPITSSLMGRCGVGVGLVVLLRLRIAVVLMRPRIVVILLRPGIVGVRVVVISVAAVIPVAAAVSSSSSSSRIVVAILRKGVIRSDGAIVFSAILR